MKKNVIIIAEAGVNHNGEISLAKKLIDIAAEAGADYVRFQTFKSEDLVSMKAKKADYQIKNMSNIKDDTQFKMLKKLELSKEDHYSLIDYSKKKNIKFLSTAFDLRSINFLDSLGLDFFKIPSGEITNYPYLKRIAQIGKRVILSTGMCSMDEVKKSVNTIFNEGNEKLILLHF